MVILFIIGEKQHHVRDVTKPRHSFDGMTTEIPTEKINVTLLKYEIKM